MAGSGRDFVYSGHGRLATANADGAPKIHGELLKLGIEISESTVSKYLVRHSGSPSQSWKIFLENHVKDMVSADFFTVPTIRFQILYVFLVVAHERRRILHFAVTAHRQRSGPLTNFERPFRGTRRRAFFYAIVIVSLGKSSWNRRRQWASQKFFPHLTLRGSVPT